MDYKGNSDKAKKKELDVPKKKIDSVVTGKVIVKKKSLGQKIKDVFVEADFRSVTRYIVSDVLIPAARNMIVDASTKGVERIIYGDRAPRRGYGNYGGYGPSRMSYGGSPLRTDYRGQGMRAPSPYDSRAPRATRNEYITETREEAMNVLQSMHDILEMYQEVSVGDLHELMDLETTHVDQKWGWFSLVDSHVRSIREGYLIELPPMQSI